MYKLGMEQSIKKSITFEVVGEPKGKGRPRFTRSGHTYTPQATKDYERHISQAAFVAMVEAGYTVIDRPVVVDLLAEMPIPKSWTKKRQLTASMDGEKPKKPDIDNVLKAALDACNGIVYHDDAQVHVVTARKRYAQDGSQGRLVVSIAWT